MACTASAPYFPVAEMFMQCLDPYNNLESTELGAQELQAHGGLLMIRQCFD